MNVTTSPRKGLQPSRKIGGKEDEHGDRTSGGRTGEPHEKLFAYRGDADVEAGQPQGRARDVEKGHADAELAVTFEHPHPRRERGSHAESHEIGQRVVLDAKFAGGVGEAGDFPVQPVHEGAEQDGQSTAFDIALHRKEHGKKAGEEAGGGEKVREDVYAPPNGFFFLHNEVPVGILHRKPAVLKRL